METLRSLVWIINIISALSVVSLVLMQHGPGADAGASFGASARGVFGATGSANFLSRLTAVAVTIFFASCLAMSYLISTQRDILGLGLSSTPPAATSSSAAPAAPSNTSTAPSTPAPTPPRGGGAVIPE